MGERALGKGQFLVARTACFKSVLAIGLVGENADIDPRWDGLSGDETEYSTKEEKLTKLDRETLHSRALVGKARCLVLEVSARDPFIRNPSSRDVLYTASQLAMSVMEIALGTDADESLYWLCKNATRVIRDASVLLIDSGNVELILPSIIFSVRALESHPLLATPRHLGWRLDLVAMCVACFDDVSPDVDGKKSLAAGTAFLEKAKLAVEDLKSLEAMDASPMDDETKNMYATADQKIKAMYASRDAEHVLAFAELLEASETDVDFTNAQTQNSTLVLELLEMTHSDSPALPAIQETASTWITKRTDAAFVWYRHAEKVAAYEQEKETFREQGGEPEERDAGEKDTPEEGNDEGNDGESSSSPVDAPEPPLDLTPNEQYAYELTVFEFREVSTLTRFLKFSGAFESGDAFGALVRYANLRLKKSGPKPSIEHSASAEDALAFSQLTQTVELLVALRLAEGGTVAGGENDGEESKCEGDGEEETAKERNSDGHTTRLASAIAACSPELCHSSTFSEHVTRGGLLLWRFACTKFEKFNAKGTATWLSIVNDEDEQLVITALDSASHAFESLDLNDHTLRIVILLKLCSLYEKQGDRASLKRANELAEVACSISNKARDTFVANAVGSKDEAEKCITGEAVWGEDAEKTDGCDREISHSFLFSFTPTRQSESSKRTACLAADALSLSVKLKLKLSLEKAGYDELKIPELLPAEVLDELNDDAHDNSWERAIIAMESSVFIGRKSRRVKALENSVRYLQKAEHAERSRLVNLKKWDAVNNSNSKTSGGDSPRSPLGEEQEQLQEENASVTLQSHKKKRSLVPSRPKIVRVTGDSITIEPPDFGNLRSANANKPAPTPDQFAVVIVPFGAGFTPGIRNDAFPGAGVLRDIVGSGDGGHNDTNKITVVTISGLTKNVAYAISVVAYQKGVVINGVGEATEPVVAAHPLPSTTLWSRLAVISSRCGCVEVARKAAATIRRRFVEIDAKETKSPYGNKQETNVPNIPTNPATCQRLRRDVVRQSSAATLRAAARALLVSAEVLTATKLPIDDGSQNNATREYPDHAPLPELRVPKHRAFLTRLDVVKRCLLAMELGSYAGDELLTQECGLRAGNALAEIIAAAQKKPKAAVSALMQVSVLLEQCGVARTPQMSRFAASVAFELTCALRACGEKNALHARAARLLTVDALVAPLGASNPELTLVEERLLHFPEWRTFQSETLSKRAEASIGVEAGDPVAAVSQALGMFADGSDSAVPSPAQVAFDALTALNETVIEHPGQYLRAFGVVLDAAIQEIRGDEGDHTVSKTVSTVLEWKAAVFAQCDKAAQIPETAFPDSTGKDDDYSSTALEEEDEAVVFAVEQEVTDEMRSCFEAGEPIPLEDDADDEATRVYEEALSLFQSAAGKIQAAEQARSEANEKAQRRERAARCLTRLAPPLLTRRSALLKSRAISNAQHPWRSKTNVSIGRLAWEAMEGKNETGEDADAADPDTDADPDAPPLQKPAVSIEALQHLTRGVELAARSHHYGRLLEATRALRDLSRDPNVGFGVDDNFAKGGGARLLSTAAGRVLEHLQMLKEGTLPVWGVTGGVTDDLDSGNRVNTHTEENSVGFFMDDEDALGTLNDTLKSTQRPSTDPTSIIFTVTGGGGRGDLMPAPLVQATARTLTLATKKREQSVPLTTAFPLLAVAFASETTPPIDGGYAAWFVNRPGVRIEFMTSFVKTAVEVCVDAGYHHRASKLALELCEIVGTDRVCLDILPKVQRSLRFCEDADGTVVPFLADAARAALHRAEANVPEHVKCLRAARASAFGVSDNKTTLSLYAKAVNLSSTVGDRVLESQSRLEWGDALYASGDIEEAVRAWGACLDRVVGRYDVAFDKKYGGVDVLPVTPEATLSMFGLTGCLRAATAAARIATRTVVTPFRAGQEYELPPSDSSDQALVGIGTRVEIAKVASKLYEACLRAGVGDARFFGGDFYASGGNSSVLSGDSFSDVSDVVWEGLGDSVVDGFEGGYTFDVKGVLRDVASVAEILLISGIAPTEAAVCASLGEAIASRRLRDLRATMDCRLKRCAALVDLGNLGTAANVLIDVIEGRGVPSISGGGGGRFLADVPDRGSDDMAGGENTEGDESSGTPAFPELGPPRFIDSEPLWSEGNQRCAKYFQTFKLADGTKHVYGDELTLTVELTRARWLVQVAASSAPKAFGVDAETDFTFFGNSKGTSVEASDEDTSGDSQSNSVDPKGKDECLSSAKSALLGVIDSVEDAVKAVAQQGQAEVDEITKKLDDEELENKNKKEARDLSVREWKERKENAENKKKFDGDWSDNEEETGKGAEGDVEVEDAGDPNETGDEEISLPYQDTRPEACQGENISPWIMASPERLRILLDANLLLSKCLFLRRDVAGALRVAKSAADEADALACGTPKGCVVGGTRARNAAAVAARVGASRGIALRVTAVSSSFSLSGGEVGDAVICEARNALRVCNAFGDVDASRRLRFIIAKAEASQGNVSVAEKLLASLLVDSSGGTSTGGLKPYAPASFYAAVARYLSRLKARTGDTSGAAALLTNAVERCRRVTIACGGFGVCGNNSSADIPELVQAHAAGTSAFVATAALWAQYVLSSRGGGRIDQPKLKQSLQVLTMAALAAKSAASVGANLEAKVALLTGFCKARIVSEEIWRNGGGSKSLQKTSHQSLIQSAIESLKKAGRLAFTAQAGHDLSVMRAAALELFSAHVVENGTGKTVSVLSGDTLSAQLPFINVLVQCLRAAFKSTQTSLALSSTTQRLELSESLSAGDAFPMATVAFVEAEETVRSQSKTDPLSFDPTNDAATSLSRRVFATRARLAARLTMEGVEDTDVDIGGDGGEALAFLGETHLAAKSSETYGEKFSVNETPECFVDNSKDKVSKDADTGTEAEDDADASDDDITVPYAISQWRTPISPPTEFRKDRRTKLKTPTMLSFVVRSGGEKADEESGEKLAGETNAETDSSTTEKSSACVFGELCVDISLVRKAQRAVRQARNAMCDLGETPVEGKADEGNDATEEGDAENGDNTGSGDAVSEEKALALAKATAALSLVVELFAQRTLLDANGVTTNGSGIETVTDKLGVTFPELTQISVSFLDKLERFISPELGVVAEADATFAKFVKQVLSQTS